MENYEHWTESARDCYKRGGFCKGCFYESFFADKPYKCRMKFAVLNLVKHKGAPPNIKSAGYYEDDEKIGGGVDSRGLLLTIPRD